MSISLFDFQEDFVDKIAKAFRKEKRVIGQLPTGGGKGRVLAEVAKRSILKGNVVCIGCHREEIFLQIVQALRDIGIFPSLIMPGSHPMPGNQCYVAMVETICRRVDKGVIDRLRLNFFILDEVHYGSYQKLIDQLNCPVLGFTATPKTTGATAGKKELKEQFGAIACGIPAKELIRIGRLVPAKTYSVKHDFSKVKTKRSGDYDEKALFQEFKKPKLWDGAVKAWLKHCPGVPTLCYNVNVEHSHETANQFRDAGYKVAHVDGATAKEDRRAIFEMFRSGQITVVCNVGIATTGTDLPNARCVVENYASNSLVKVVQVKGRGGRCDDGKDFFFNIDMGRNYIRHGEFGDDIDWLHIFNNPSEAIKKESKREKRECDECGAVMRISLQVCPYCGAFTSKRDMEEILLEGASTEEIKAYKLKTVPIHLRKPLNQMSDLELKAYGRHMGYQPRWFWVMKQLILDGKA